MSAERRQIKVIKGVRDILPPESALWNRVEQTARDVFATYGYGEIRLPTFEETELFARSVGTDTDIVSKEMYTFEDRPPAEIQLIVDFLRFAGFDPRSNPDLATYVSRLNQLTEWLEDQHDAGLVFSSDDAGDAYSAFVALQKDANQFLAAATPIDEEEWFRLRLRVTAALGFLRYGYSMSLRPEATASVCRAYIEHGMHTLPGDVKLYYIGPMFRRERPQKGRYRQFYQIGAEVLGQSDAPAIDAEVIEMLMVFFERVGLTRVTERGSQITGHGSRVAEHGSRVTLYINSIGCKECRPKYVEKLREALLKVKDHQLAADSRRRIETNPLRVLDSKVPEEQPIIEKLPRIGDYLCDDCRKHFAEVQAQLKLREISYELNWRLVRGLDYYMRTTFEITAPGLGAQNAVCGGGRYDGLVELLGGPKDIKGIGFAIGTDRLILSLQETGAYEVQRSLDVFVAWVGGAAKENAVRFARQLREVGLSVEVPPEETKFRKALDLANRIGARYAVLIAENEVSSGLYTVKRLSDGEQVKVPADELVAHLRSQIAQAREKAKA